jgi:VCBS repeat-containing protein
MLTGTVSDINAFIAASGVSYIPAPNDHGTRVLTVSINDVGNTGSGGALSHTRTVDLHVSAVNDVAVIGGTDAGSVAENGTLIAIGMLTVADEDAGEAAFKAQADVQGTYGTFSFDAILGKWTYVLDNEAEATKTLRSGEVVTETFTVETLDSTMKTVSVQVKGHGTLVGGVEVSTETIAYPDGSTGQTLTIPIITADTGAADIPLVMFGGSILVHAQLPVGFGLQASGPSAPKTAGTSLADLIREIKAHSPAGSPDQGQLTGGGSGFLGGLPANAPLLVQTLVPTVAVGSTMSPGQPLVISGNSSPGTPATALVIDAQGLPTGTHLQLHNVEFAAVIGSIKVTGGAGSQVVFGDSASQHMVLGADDDVLHGGGGRDYVGSLGGDDRLYGDDGNDTVSGGIGSDRLWGGNGQDRLLGGSGRDRLDGGTGHDNLKGDSGDDWLTGGLGRDKLWGGAGRDVFDFNAVKESKVGAQRDVVYDFQSGRDRIDLRGIDANETRKGNQAFSWAGSDGPFLHPKESAAFLKAGFTGEAGQLRFAAGILMGDVDGDGRADFQIRVIGKFIFSDVIL